MEFTTQLLIESWTLYVLGFIIVTCRFIARRMKLGKWKKLELDDYMMAFAFVNFTGVVVSINQVAKNGSNYMAPEVAAALTPAGVRQAVYGSIMTLVLEVFTLTATWTIKGCLLIFYARLTRGTNTWQKLFVKMLTVYVCVCYVLIMLMLLFFWCKPVSGYWAVPVQDEQCATYYHHMIFATAFNIFSDIMLFCIPIPIIVKTKLPLKRKIILVAILGLGVFNILAAILNRYYNFSNPNSYVFLFWYVAEVGIAVYVGNLPLCWPLLRMVLGKKGDSSSPSYANQPDSYRRKQAPLRSGATSSAWGRLDDEKSAGGGYKRDASDSDSQIELVTVEPHHKSSGSTDSKHHVAVTESTARSDGPNSRSMGDKIMVTTVVDVTR